MNKYTFVALVHCLLSQLPTRKAPQQYTHQQEALFTELGLQVSALTLDSRDVSDLNRALLSLFVCDVPLKGESLSKKVRAAIDDGRIILELRFENFDFQGVYRRHARIAV